MRAVILDGYVDEPTCLGVPPYISPYVRYIAGAIRKKITAGDSLLYLTIDQIREKEWGTKALSKADLIVIIAGTAVPGKYLSGTPASPFEIKRILKEMKNPVKILSGPAAEIGFGMEGGKSAIDPGMDEVLDLVITGDAEVVISDLFEEREVDPTKKREDASQIREYANEGAFIVKQHPNYPFIVAEIETYRGCPRVIKGGCSFCTEPRKGLPDFRPIEHVVEEVRCLYEVGVRHFRLGAQPCLFSYMARGVGEKEFPVPNPDAIEKLYRGIRNVAPELKTLHLDNVNPGTVAKYPEESKKIAKIIVKYHTPGDVASMGIESADPEVIKRNNLKASFMESLEAVRIINEVGRKRGYNGLPELLPGLNFVFGLIGETEKTYEADYNFLRILMERNLQVRRINLRQVMIFGGTKMKEIGNRTMKRNKAIFKRFKEKIRKEIDQEMLKRVIPAGTVLRDVLTEIHKGKTTFGRQMGTYPILVGIPGIHELRRFFDVKIINHGYRSVTGIPYPLNINSASLEVIQALPDVGRKRAARIGRKRPFRNEEEFVRSFDNEEVGKK
ncbi:MAG: radical SAM protein, partial [Candidatus Syntropharchaeia archaeon]